MKTKKFNKRLDLNKKTIADLNNSDMIKVKGGCYPTMHNSGCPTGHTYRCTYVICTDTCIPETLIC